MPWFEKKGAWSRFKVGVACLFQESQELSEPQFSHLQNGWMRTVGLTESWGGFAETQDSLARGKGSEVFCVVRRLRDGVEGRQNENVGPLFKSYQGFQHTDSRALNLAWVAARGWVGAARWKTRHQSTPHRGDCPHKAV